MLKLIKQQHKMSCAIACLSMITGVDYDKIIEEFNLDFDERAITSTNARNYIIDHGLSVIEKEYHSFNDISTSNKRMLEPFANIHYISVRQTPISKYNHAVIMDGIGNIYCTDRGLIITSKQFLKETYLVERIIGCWKN